MRSQNDSYCDEIADLEDEKYKLKSEVFEVDETGKLFMSLAKDKDDMQALEYGKQRNQSDLVAAKLSTLDEMNKQTESLSLRMTEQDAAFDSLLKNNLETVRQTESHGEVRMIELLKHMEEEIQASRLKSKTLLLNSNLKTFLLDVKSNNRESMKPLELIEICDEGPEYATKPDITIKAAPPIKSRKKRPSSFSASHSRDEKTEAMISKIRPEMKDASMEYNPIDNSSQDWHSVMSKSTAKKEYKAFLTPSKKRPLN